MPGTAPAAADVVRAAQVRAVTFRNERLRSIASGIIESGTTTFVLLIALQVYQADNFAKGILAAGNNAGYLLAPLLVSFVQRRGWRGSRTAAALFAVAAVCYAVAAAVPTLAVYVLMCVGAAAIFNMVAPLLTQMYQDNYPARERGKLFSAANVIRVACAALFSELAGRALSLDSAWYHTLLAAFAAAAAFAALCLRGVPGTPLTHHGQRNPFHGLRYLFTDRSFAILMLTWTLLGFATLMMMPLRVEYLANPKYGQNLDPLQIALFVSVVPAAVRLVMSPIWGHIFDRMSFYAIRIVLNIGFAIGIAAFFADGSPAGLWISSIVIGISNAGGDLVWNLWVTKFTTGERVADYMAVHTFLTGVRGVLAPLVAFQLATSVPLQTLGLIATGIVLASALLLFPEMMAKHRAESGVKSRYERL